VTAIDVVTADGEARRVDADNDPDLFWALRGGGGGYAIVTALHLALVPIAEVYAGALILPAEAGAEAVRAYRDWAAGVPDEVTSIARFLRPPPLPDVPEPLRDRPLLTLGAACIGSREEGERTIAPLREIGEPIMDTFDQIPAAGLSRIHMDPEQPVPGLGHHEVIRELPDEAIDVFVDAAGPDSGSPLLLAELRQAGGALGRPAENGGALSKLDGAFVMLGIGLPMTPELGEAIDAHLDRLHEAMQPWGGEGGYFNFAERPCDVEAILPPETCARLAEVKRRWDPHGMIRANHALSVAAA
jgi:FAD/FMN-containing dehydrogenase